MQVPREQVEYMYQLIEAQRDFFLGVKEQWKVKLNFIHVYMYACLHDYLPLVCILTGEGRRQPGLDSQLEAANSCSAGG